MDQGQRSGPRRRRRRRGRTGQPAGSGLPQPAGGPTGSGQPSIAEPGAPPLRPGRETPPAGAREYAEYGGYVLALPDGRLIFRPAERPSHALRPSPAGDATLSPDFARAYGLRPGDFARLLLDDRRARLRVVEAVEVAGLPPDQAARRPHFEQMTAEHPQRLLRLERPGSVTARLLDLFAPLGFGSRALVVSPPKAGKTTILREIALSSIANYPDVRVICCLVGERPEEATEFGRLLPRETRTGTPVEVVATTFDDLGTRHAALADLTAERARRLVEGGSDVVLVVDSLTRLVRAYNLTISSREAGRTLSGGVSAGAIIPSRRFFGAARAMTEGPSLTVIATCLIDTGSRQDDLVYEELKGTGNSEIVLDRRLAERRLFPALNIGATGTRREELLLSPDRLEAVRRVRRVFASAENPIQAMQRLIERIEATSDNDAFLASLPALPGGS